MIDGKEQAPPQTIESVIRDVIKSPRQAKSIFIEIKQRHQGVSEPEKKLTSAQTIHHLNNLQLKIAQLIRELNQRNPQDKTSAGLYSSITAEISAYIRGIEHSSQAHADDGDDGDEDGDDDDGALLNMESLGNLLKKVLESKIPQAVVLGALATGRKLLDKVKEKRANSAKNSASKPDVDGHDPSTEDASPQTTPAPPAQPARPSQAPAASTGESRRINPAPHTFPARRASEPPTPPARPNPPSRPDAQPTPNRTPEAISEAETFKNNLMLALHAALDDIRRHPEIKKSAATKLKDPLKKGEVKIAVLLLNQLLALLIEPKMNLAETKKVLFKLVGSEQMPNQLNATLIAKLTEAMQLVIVVLYDAPQSVDSRTLQEARESETKLKQIFETTK